MHRNHRGAHSIQKAFANFMAIPILNGGVGHQMTHVAHQHQRSTLQGFCLTAAQIAAIGVQNAIKRRAAFGDGLTKITAHEAKPVCISQNFVWRIHSRNRIFTIHDH